MNVKYFSLLAIITIVLFGCGEKKFRIDGEIADGKGKTVVLEKADFSGSWIPVDSAKINGSGSFSISSPAPVSPDIFRLSMDGNYIYMPVDSTENLKLSTTAADFGRKYTLSGSDQAELMTRFEHDLMSLPSSDDATLTAFKKKVYSNYIQNGNGSIVSYYILTKTHNGKPLYDPQNADDAKYYAAVATQFEHYRPDDPHGKMVKEASIEALRNRNNSLGRKTVIKANELAVIDFELPDVAGKNVKLSDVVGKGKPVVVVFSLMNETDSPNFNRQLSDIYSAQGGKVQIVQVSFDKDQFAWREAASNLPWINLFDGTGTSSKVLLSYNVGSIPAVFLYNASGELVDRPESLDDLKKKL